MPSQRQVQEEWASLACDDNDTSTEEPQRSIAAMIVQRLWLLLFACAVLVFLSSYAGARPAAPAPVSALSAMHP